MHHRFPSIGGRVLPHPLQNRRVRPPDARRHLSPPALVAVSDPPGRDEAADPKREPGQSAFGSATVPDVCQPGNRAITGRTRVRRRAIRTQGVTLPSRRRSHAMQVAVLSDIHANRHALEAVLDDVRRTGARELWCLGDLVGYGADPNDCVALVREHVDVCIAGNHDLAVTGELPLEDFSRRRGAGGRLDAGGDRARPPRVPGTLRPQLDHRRRRPLPRQPARPGLGVRRRRAARRAVPGPPAGPHRADRAQPHRAVVRPRGRRSRRPARRAATARRRHQRGLLAAEPRQRRPAARRRSARGLDAARPHAGNAPRGGASTTTSPARRRRSATRGCPTRSPTGWDTVSDRAPAALRGSATLPAALRAALAIAGCGQRRAVPASDASKRSTRRCSASPTRPTPATATRADERARPRPSRPSTALPSSVDARLRTRIAAGLEQLTQTVPEQCAQDGDRDDRPSRTTGPEDARRPSRRHDGDDRDRAARDRPRRRRPRRPPTEPATDPDTETAPIRGGAQGPDGHGPPGQLKKAGRRGGERLSRSPIATSSASRSARGGMSTVVLAFDRRLERHVAVKLLAEHLADDRQFVSRFRREALAAARLVHPNIVQVFDFGLDEPTAAASTSSWSTCRAARAPRSCVSAGCCPRPRRST